MPYLTFLHIFDIPRLYSSSASFIKLFQISKNFSNTFTEKNQCIKWTRTVQRSTVYTIKLADKSSKVSPNTAALSSLSTSTK